MTNRKFDRIPSQDTRNDDYPVSLLWTKKTDLGTMSSVPTISTKKWNDYAYLDQGPDGACVGFGISGELASDPEIVENITNATAHAVYLNAQQIDEWPGGEYPGATPQYEGTSVLAGAKVAQNQGYYTSYLWAKTENDMAATVSNFGPVVIGVNWYEDMMDPDTDGYLRPTGSVVGGHCVVVIGINAEEDYYTIRNSWGQSWGDNGEAKISREDMAYLISQDGDVMKPTRVHIGPDPVNPTPPSPAPNLHCGFWCKLACFFETGKWGNC
jgi:hypothetical protein